MLLWLFDVCTDGVILSTMVLFIDTDGTLIFIISRVVTWRWLPSFLAMINAQVIDGCDGMGGPV